MELYSMKMLKKNYLDEEHASQNKCTVIVMYACVSFTVINIVTVVAACLHRD